VASLKQIEANRRNSQLSTGPRTEAGKQITCMNALKTGIHAESHIIRGEDPAELAQLAAEYNAEFHPVTPRQRDLVDTLVHNEWKIRRLRALEADLWERSFQCDVISADPDTTNRYTILDRQHPLATAFRAINETLDSLQRRIHAYERSTTRALRQLKEIKQLADELASFPETRPQASPAPAPQPPAPSERSETLPCTMVAGPETSRQAPWNSGAPAVVQPEESFPNYDSHH